MTVKHNEPNTTNGAKEDAESFSFIQEQIVPKKRSKRKKFFHTILFTILIAVIFGLISSCIFCLSHPLFQKMFGNEEEGTVVLNTSTPSPSPTKIPLQSPTTNPDKEIPTAKPTVAPPATTNYPEEENVENYMWAYEGLSEIVQEVNQSIVTVKGVTSEVDYFNNPYENTNVSAGLIVAKNYRELFILASKNRISDADNILITFEEEQTVDATIVASDADVGVVILAVSIKSVPEYIMDEIKVAKFGNSFAISNGNPIIAIGSPNGYMYSVEYGIITNHEKAVYITDYQIDLFNTDITHNENGEGYIVNLKGEIVGMITNNFTKGLNKDINTAIGIDKLSPVIESLINKSNRQYFGIVGNNINKEIGNKIGISSGIYVAEVEADSPAFKAGIKTEDVIQSINNTEVITMTDFHKALTEYEVKDKITITLIRKEGDEKKEIKVNVTIGQK